MRWVVHRRTNSGADEYGVITMTFRLISASLVLLLILGASTSFAVDRKKLELLPPDRPCFFLLDEETGEPTGDPVFTPCDLDKRVIQKGDFVDPKLRKKYGKAYEPEEATTVKSSKNNSSEQVSGEDAAARGRGKARRACVKSGGDFVESPTGYICIHKMETLRSENPNPDALLRSKKRKCWKAGGNWVTNENGSYCTRNTETSSK
jgi:hypothetical protein